MNAIPDCIRKEPFAQYRRQAAEHLGSHALGDFRKSPLLYRKKHVLKCIPESESSAYLEGRAGHSLILEGRSAYASEFVTDGDAPVNPRTGKPFGPTSDKYKAWAASQPGEVISGEMADRIEAMYASVRAHEVASDLLSGGIAEGVVRAVYHGEPCQIRMDYFKPGGGIVDLKTCDDLTWFEHDARRYGYPWQMAFYRSVLREAYGRECPVFIVAVEKKEPYRCGVWRMGEDILGHCEGENGEAISRLQLCRERGVWPSGYEELRTFDVL